ncbi:DUF3519 domain-containing protein [Helicobacter pylori]|nr:DUF3519 domain-containing protein [Helicobacter pylori]
MQGLENNNIDLKNLPSTPLYPLKKIILTPEQLEQKRKDLIVDLNQKSKELTELGLLDKLGEFVGIQTDNAKEREKQITDLKTQALDNKIEFKDLPGTLKDEYYNKAETSIFNPLKTKNEIAKQDYQKDLQRKEILQKTSKELTKSDKELIDNDSGFFNNVFDAIAGKSEVEKLKEYKEKEKAKDITKDLQKSWNLFDNLRKDKDAFSLFASEDKELREKYQNEFKNIVRNNGFDDVVYNEKQEPFVRKGDKFYKINDRFFDNFLNSLSANKFSLAGSLLGSYRGAKAGKNLGALGLMGGAIVGGALGSTAGGAADAIAGNAFLNREQKADEIIRHALSDGALSLVTDTVVLGAGKFIQKAINPRNIFNIGANVSTSGLYALGKHIVTGNAKGAERILNETISENERQAVRELAKQFGGELKLTKADGSKYREELVKKVGEDSKIVKGYDALRDAFLLQSQAKKQEAFIQAIRSDETGNAIAFLSEAANSSPIANANLKKILNQTTENLKNSLRQLDLKDYEVKSIFDNLEQGTKESYEKALDGIIGKLYDNSYKTNLRESIQDTTAFETFVKGLREQGKFDPTANSFLNQVEKNIYSPDGVTYEQLRNARQMINAYERNVKDPSTLGYIKKISAQFLREDIDKGIENILKQNTQAYEKLSDLNKTAISDYKNMKQTLELVDSAKIRDREITKEKAIENLMQVIQAQGEKDLSNYAVLTKALSEQDKEKLELSMLNALMEKSTKQGENLKVFDSTHFFTKLNEFKDDVFTTPKAKQYIDIAKGFDKLFRNDATIAGKINYATTKDIKSPLATSLEGALNQKLTQRLVGTIVRNIPTTHIFKKLDELSGGAALKYHIKRALERSHSISEFSKQLELSVQKSHFSNNTLKIIEELNNGIKQASEEIKTKASDLQRATTPLKEFGKNYPEFALKPKEALEKLLQEKNGQVAGAAYRDDLGGIDFVWGTPKTKESVGYGLEHILKRREEQAIAKGLNEAEAKEYALNIVKSIPEVLEKGTKGTDHLGRVFVDYGNKRVGLNNTWNNKDLENHWVISSYELRDTTEKPTHFPTSQAITKEKDIHSLNSVVEPNPTPKPLNSQEDLLKTSENLNETTQKPTNLSPLEQANAEKLAKLQREQEQSEQEFLKAKEQELKRKEALKKKLEHERGNAGNIESQTKIEVGEDIPTKTQDQLPKSRVRLNEREIYDLDYAIVKAKDLKPSFTTGGTQKRTDMNEEQIKSIAENFDPKKIFGSGGFEDLPIILHDGQVIAGNHRIQGMLNFTPKSRFAYERAIKEYYNIVLKPDELLVRVPHNRLNNTEINNLAASSNQGRFNSESDHAIAVLSHYEAKLKELDQKLDADSIYSLKNIVAKNLNFDKATHPNVGDSNLALLMFNMPRTKTQGIELLNRWQKEFSNDIKSYEKVKKMFVDNAGSFHNLIHDMNFPKVSLNAYLSDIMDRSFANLKNYQTTSESLKDLSEKFYKTSSLEMFEKSDQKTSDISEILGASVARFARFDDPSKALFEALRSDNIKKGLKEFKIADVTKDMFNPDSKEFKDIDIYDFTHYLLMVNREPNENNPVLNRLIQAVKDMQKESEKGIKKQKLEALKKLDFDEITKLIDESPRTGSSMPILGMQNLNAEAVEYIQKNHKRIAVEKIEPSFAKDLKLKYPDDARAVIDYQAINHILKEHKNLSFEDIANYRELSKQANETLKLKDNQNRPVVASFNQINGFFVVVEQVSNAKNELMLKTMYKARGNYKDSLIYKRTLAKSQNSN